MLGQGGVRVADQFGVFAELGEPGNGNDGVEFEWIEGRIRDVRAEEGGEDGGTCVR